MQQLSLLWSRTRQWQKSQWQSAGLLLFIGSCVIALVPVLRTATPPQPRLPHIPTTAVDLNAFYWQKITVSKGQTLGAIFTELGLSQPLMQQILHLDSAQQSLHRIKQGNTLEFELNGHQQFRALRFDKSALEQITISAQNAQLSESVLHRKLETRLMVASGEIRNSLSADGQRAGLSAKLVNEIANVFKYDIDFVEDLRDGDQFHVVYEQSYIDGKPYQQSSVVAATFTTQGKQHSAFRYALNGKTQYFDQTGRPLKKVLLRIPIEFARLSSTFGMRKHPVLGRMRAHKGVDYAAHSGTPIMAAGDGRIEFSGWKNGYGQVIIINHGQGRSTLYGHMSALGKYRRGQNVAQGAIIGRVGMTGLATGPHLHYEFRVNGNQVNPLTVTMPKPAPLMGNALARFRASTASSIALMAQPNAATLR